MMFQQSFILFFLINVLLQYTYAEVCPLIRSRVEWNADNRKEFTVLDQPVEYAIIAHTATQGCNSFNSCSNIVKYIQSFHMNQKGFSDIGYNFLIGGDGSIYEGAGFDGKGSHSKRYNAQSLGIAFIGDYNNISPKDVQIEALQKLLNCATFISSLKRNYKLVGHRQMINTQSPGTHLYREIKKMDHWTRLP